MSYYTKITTAGLAAITAAMNNSSKVPITYMAFGDGNGSIPEPDENATSLVNEVYRVGLNKVEVHSKNPNWLVCEAIIPSAVGGFNIREVALYDSTGNTMLAIASYPPTYKPTVEEGASKIQTIRIVIQVDNTGNFVLVIDPDVVLATHKSVIELIEEKTTLKFNSIEELRNNLGLPGQVAITKSYYPPVYGQTQPFWGGSEYKFDPDQINTDDGFLCINGWVLQPKGYVTPFQAGAKGDLQFDDSSAIDKCIASKYKIHLPIPLEGYRYTKEMVTNGTEMIADSAPPELYGSSSAKPVVIYFDGVSGNALTNKGTLSKFSKIWFKQKDWSTQLNGLFLERYAYFEDCLFTHFNGYGFYSWTDGLNETGLAAYHSVFHRCQFLFNRKHGVSLFNGANAIALYDCLSRWNGSPSYGMKPTVAGLYDGLYVDGQNSDYPSSYKLEPQGCLVSGGDYSYNSRYGQNWHSCGQNVLQGGYIENNLVHDLRLGSIFGMQVVNPFTKRVIPLLNVIEQSPNDAAINLDNYPNQIVVNGTDYGTGLIYSAASTQRGASTIKHLPVFRTKTGVTNMYVYTKFNGEFWFECATRGNSVNFSDTVPLKANNLRIGAYARSSVSDSDSIRAWFSSNTGAEGEAIATFVGQDAPFATIRTAKGSGANSADCFFSMTKNSITNRTINAAGTINASGADYAEYMYKADNCDEIQKGEIVGVNSEGQLTKQYDESVSFVVKSTEPSVVGGDTWFSEEFRETEPQYSFDKELAEDATQNEIDEFNRLKSEHIAQLKSEITSYKQRKADFDERMELARQKVDRIAFCGQVPISYVAEVGDYIIPTRDSDGSICIETTRAPNFEQYLKCVGKVWKIINGIPHIIIYNN